LPGISSKEATRIEESLHVSEMLVKKCNAMAAQCTDPDCRRLMQDLGNMHRRHYDMLLRRVNAAAGAVGTTTWPQQTTAAQTAMETGTQAGGQTSYPATVF